MSPAEATAILAWIDNLQSRLAVHTLRKYGTLGDGVNDEIKEAFASVHPMQSAMNALAEIAAGKPPTYRVGLDDDGGLDEVVATGSIHIERMNEGHWWIGILRHDGADIRVNLCAENTQRTKVTGRIEVTE